MSDSRLPAHLEASSLLRRAEAKAGFGMILRKGDADRGSLLLLIASRGVHFACLERAMASCWTNRWSGRGIACGMDVEARPIRRGFMVNRTGYPGPATIHR
jgi:hypothetical protein